MNKEKICQSIPKSGVSIKKLKVRNVVKKVNPVTNSKVK